MVKEIDRKMETIKPCPHQQRESPNVFIEANTKDRNKKAQPINIIGKHYPNFTKIVQGLLGRDMPIKKNLI